MTLAHPTLDQMRGELRVGEDFLAKYNHPGPRYTSYPTAPVWNDTFGPADLQRVHDEAERASTPISLYMHIPFCESLCLFCACNVVIQKNKSVAPPYLDVLKQEMKRISRSVSKNRPVVQFHWGGGTPTYLTPEQIEDLFAFTKEHFHFALDSEIGIEVDPRVTSRAHLENLRKLGFNRLSMGIQDLHADVQKAVHRIQPYELTRQCIGRLVTRPQHGEHDDRLTFELVRDADRRRLEHGCVRRGRGFHLGGPHALARHLEGVVAAALDVPEAVVIDARPVAVHPDIGEPSPVGRDVLLWIAPEPTRHPRPGPANDEL